MGLFGKSAQQKRIDALAAESAGQALTIKRLTKEVADTGVLLTQARDGRDIAYRQNAHLIAEIAKVERERDDYRERLLRFTGPRQRGERGRFVAATH